jgi:hypothetical protein
MIHSDNLKISIPYPSQAVAVANFNCYCNVMMNIKKITQHTLLVTYRRRAGASLRHDSNVPALYVANRSRIQH